MVEATRPPCLYPRRHRTARRLMCVAPDVEPRDHRRSFKRAVDLSTRKVRPSRRNHFQRTRARKWESLWPHQLLHLPGHPEPPITAPPTPSGATSPTPPSPLSRKTLLSEIMGKFDESYVYKKETDILSDSDPTDCDDYDDQGGEGGDEQTEEDLDDFDYIDKRSSNDLPDALRRNRGHCTYHSFGSELVGKCSKSSSCRSSRRRQRRVEENRSERSTRQGKFAE